MSGLSRTLQNEPQSFGTDETANTFPGAGTVVASDADALKDNSARVGWFRPRARFNWKITSFFVVLLGIIILTNSGGLEWLLDTFIGTTWSHKLVEFLKEETKGFIVLFFVVLFLEIRREGGKEKAFERVERLEGGIASLERSFNQIQERLDDDYLARLEPNMAVEKLLYSRYGSSRPVQNLIATVIPDRPFYTDASVEIRLTDNRDHKERFDIEYEMTFSSSFEEFLVAFVPSTTIQDQIAAFCPLINEVFTYPDAFDRADKVKELQKGGHHCRLSVITGSSSQERPMKFEKLTLKDAEFYLHQLPSDSKREVTLLRAKLPKYYLGVVASFAFTMRKNIHFYYWVADRPIYMRRFTVDATGFTLMNDSKICFHPMIANTGNCKDTNPKPKVFTAEVNNWIVKGQGFGISWGDYERS